MSFNYSFRAIATAGILLGVLAQAQAGKSQALLCHKLVNAVAVTRLEFDCRTHRLCARLNHLGQPMGHTTFALATPFVWEERQMAYALVPSAGQIAFFDLQTNSLTKSLPIKVEGIDFGWLDGGIDMRTVLSRFDEEGHRFYVVSRDGIVYRSDIDGLHEGRPMKPVLDLKVQIKDLQEMRQIGFVASNDGKRIFVSMLKHTMPERKVIGVYEFDHVDGVTESSGTWKIFYDITRSGNRDDFYRQSDMTSDGQFVWTRAIVQRPPQFVQSLFGGSLDVPEIPPSSAIPKSMYHIDTQVTSKMVFPPSLAQFMEEHPASSLPMSRDGALAWAWDVSGKFVAFDPHSGEIKQELQPIGDAPQAIYTHSDSTVAMMYIDGPDNARVTALDLTQPGAPTISSFEVPTKFSIQAIRKISSSGRYLWQLDSWNFSVMELHHGPSHP